MNTKKTIITGAALLAITVPFAAFAATNSTVSNTTKKIASEFKGHHKFGSGSEMGSGREMPDFGSGLTDAQKTELKTFQESVKTAETSLKSITLTDDDKAALKAIRDTAEKAERDYLRSKGVTLPTEEAIASAKAILESNKPTPPADASGSTVKESGVHLDLGLGLGFSGGRGGHGGEGRGDKGPPSDENTNNTTTDTTTN